MSDFKQIIGHGKNYLISNIANKALAFISIPIYTRLLTTDEYGIFSVFLGVAGILGSIMALSMDRSISRYYFDRKDDDDFRKFNGTSLILSVIAFMLNAGILLIFAENFGNLVGLEKTMVLLLIPYTFINIVSLIFEQIYGVQKKSKIVSTTSLYRAYLGFLLSLVLILLFKQDKYYGLVYGQIIGGMIICLYWIKQMKPYFKIYFGKNYLKYIFTYSVPLIPYALSGIIIEQFSKIAIGTTQNISNAGYYSLALSIGSLVSIIIGVAHQAWNPYFMEYMNNKEYDKLDKDFIRIFKITIIIAFVIASFGEEIGLLLAKKSFTKSLYLIPIFTLGYVFYQLAYTYLRNFGYSKCTQHMTITVFVSGLSNVLFNIILIPIWGEMGAAISFTGSYIVMAITAWTINAVIVKQHSTSLRILLPLIGISIPFYVLLPIITQCNYWVLMVILKISLIIILSGIILYQEKKLIIEYLVKLVNPIKNK